MWLASISQQSTKGDMVMTDRWGHGVMRKARQAAKELLSGVGDPFVERGFRMLATLCVHRVVTDAELTACPTKRARFLAGPPVEELWRTESFPELPLTAKRCLNCVWQTVRIADKSVKIPGDCGDCPPCLARREFEEEADRE